MLAYGQHPAHVPFTRLPLPLRLYASLLHVVLLLLEGE
jgi:hypothetical protein